MHIHRIYALRISFLKDDAFFLRNFKDMKNTKNVMTNNSSLQPRIIDG